MCALLRMVMMLYLVSMYLVKSNLIPFLLTLVQLSKTDSCGSLRKISNISRARLPRFRKIDSRTQYSLQFLLKAITRKIYRLHKKSQILFVYDFQSNDTIFYEPFRDIHIECSKQFKWNLYFYVSGQSGSFWAVLKLL